MEEKAKKYFAYLQTLLFFLIDKVIYAQSFRMLLVYLVYSW